MREVNWIVILTKNNLTLTQKAIASLRGQDIEGGVQILVVDNDSSDGTVRWLGTQKDLVTILNKPENSVAGAWNQALDWLFSTMGNPYALVVNNDVELRPDAYRHLVTDGGGFVTCVGNRDPKCIDRNDGWAPPDPSAKRPHPDFSCFLIRKETWDKVGRFDEGFRGAFCEDWDYHCRLHKAGITAECLDLPFFHAGSATVKSAKKEDAERIQWQAAKNREYFKAKWGFAGGTDEYYAFFQSAPPEKG